AVVVAPYLAAIPLVLPEVAVAGGMALDTGAERVALVASNLAAVPIYLIAGLGGASVLCVLGFVPAVYAAATVPKSEAHTEGQEKESFRAVVHAAVRRPDVALPLWLAWWTVLLVGGIDQLVPALFAIRNGSVVAVG